jgi:hypothetical protein
MAINIRTATPADLPALGRLGALLVRAHHDFDAKRFIPATSETEAGYSWFLGTQLEKPNVAVLVADDGGEVVGYSIPAWKAATTCRSADRREYCTTSSSIRAGATTASGGSSSRRL